HKVEGKHTANKLDGRAKLRERLYQNYWNHPSDVYPSMEKELVERRALVICVRYVGLSPLRNTFTDAYNIANMLENRFQYPPKCIRVLADQPTKTMEKDKSRLPTKDNILEGLKWLAEGCTDGSRRFLYFAGHGYTSSPGEEASGREGIHPAFYRLTVIDPSESNPNFTQVMDTESVLFDWELISCLADNLPDVKLRLTALFDPRITGYNPTIAIATTIRGHAEPAEAPRPPEGQIIKENSVPRLGNILNLPMKIDPSSTTPVSPSEWATLNLENCELKSFPAECEVCSWYSSVPVQDRQFTTTFTKGVDQLMLNGVFTCQDLYAFIREALNSRHEQILPEGEGLGRAARDHQQPKLYVSENIAGFICDTEMYI
ncbi:hypothetical protein FRC06_000698, partial [Ceratobasidium sp. 370]